MPIPGGSLVLLNKKRGETVKAKSEKKPERTRDHRSDESGGATGAQAGYASSPSHQSRSPCHQRQASPNPNHTSPRHSLQGNSFYFFGRSQSGQQLASPSKSALNSPRRSHQGLQVTGGDQQPGASNSDGYVSPKSSPKLPRLRASSKSASPRRKDNN